MRHRSPNLCIWCGFPADGRSSHVISLPSGARLHGKCEWPLVEYILRIPQLRARQGGLRPPRPAPPTKP